MKRAPSTKDRSVLIAILAIPLALFLGIAEAASYTDPPVPEAAAGYPLSIGDLMISTIQPRYTNLWYAVRNKNWAFAAYELGNLQGAFKRLGQAHPREHDASFPDLIATVTEQPFKELKSAIDAKDETAFVKAYADLTAACNACHQALSHGVVVIRTPGGKSGDQDFGPAR